MRWSQPSVSYAHQTRLEWHKHKHKHTFLECPMDRVCCYILHPCPRLQLITAISQKLKFTWQIASWWWCLASLMSQILILRTHCLMVFCSRHFATSDSLIRLQKLAVQRRLLFTAWTERIREADVSNTRWNHCPFVVHDLLSMNFVPRRKCRRTKRCAYNLVSQPSERSQDSG